MTINLVWKVNLFRGDKDNPSSISSPIPHWAWASEAVAGSGCTLCSCYSQLVNVLLPHFFSILMLCTLSRTDDISDSPQGPQFVKFSVTVYVPLKKKKRIWYLWYHQDFLITTQYPHMKIPLQDTTFCSEMEFKTNWKWKGSPQMFLLFSAKVDVAQKVIFCAGGFFPN